MIFVATVASQLVDDFYEKNVWAHFAPFGGHSILNGMMCRRRNGTELTKEQLHTTECGSILTGVFVAVSQNPDVSLRIDREGGVSFV